MPDPRPQITIRIDAWVQAFFDWWGAWGLRLGFYLIGGTLVLWSGAYQPFEFVLFIVLPVGAIVAWEVYIRVHERRAMLRELAGFCSQCGYDLRASTERCPECGMEIMIRSRKSVFVNEMQEVLNERQEEKGQEARNAK